MQFKYLLCSFSRLVVHLIVFLVSSGGFFIRCIMFKDWVALTFFNLSYFLGIKMDKEKRKEKLASVRLSTNDAIYVQ